MGLKQGAIGNTLGNTLGTYWEQRKNEKKWHTPLFHWEQRTREHDAYILTLDLESVYLVAAGLGFRDYNTGMTHVKKKEQMMRMLSNFYDHTYVIMKYLFVVFFIIIILLATMF
jgi:hypothetical protein